MRLLILCLLLIIFVCGCEIESNVVKKGIVTSVVKEKNGSIDIYFCPRDNCTGKLIEFIRSAKEYVHCALFDLDLKEVIDVLQEKSDVIDVKLVVDNDYFDDLAELGFVRKDTSSQFSHNKFCVIDGEKISSGSFNPTDRGAHFNNNNFLMITSRFLAKNYEDEFQELWNYSIGKGGNVVYPVIYLDERKIENYFCPEDYCSEHVEEALMDAKDSIYFMTFSFTHNGIANVIALKMQEGVEVKGVFEKRGAGSEYSRYGFLEYQGADVRKDNNSYSMHHKVFIIDNSTVITGSFNPSENADMNNDENVLIIYDKEIAEKYLKEFKYILDNFTE
ncbi:hypothetical protein KY331_06315 [Candidatus Woesearchaeota archaeon]|nr:hypothetical protein [Candidatus Woesearchaeota archaeon]